jgi:hypothetical protein
VRWLSSYGRQAEPLADLACRLSWSRVPLAQEAFVDLADAGSKCVNLDSRSRLIAERLDSRAARLCRARMFQVLHIAASEVKTAHQTDSFET